jgi:hypothetical protein
MKHQETLRRQLLGEMMLLLSDRFWKRIWADFVGFWL